MMSDASDFYSSSDKNEGGYQLLSPEVRKSSSVHMWGGVGLDTR